MKMFLTAMMANLVSKKAIWYQLLGVGCFATNGALKFGDHEISSFFFTIKGIPESFPWCSPYFPRFLEFRFFHIRRKPTQRNKASSPRPEDFSCWWCEVDDVEKVVGCDDGCGDNAEDEEEDYEVDDVAKQV